MQVDMGQTKATILKVLKRVSMKDWISWMRRIRSNWGIARRIHALVDRQVLRGCRHLETIIPDDAKIKRKWRQLVKKWNLMETFPWQVLTPHRRFNTNPYNLFRNLSQARTRWVILALSGRRTRCLRRKWKLIDPLAHQQRMVMLTASMMKRMMKMTTSKESSRPITWRHIRVNNSF